MSPGRFLVLTACLGALLAALAFADPAAWQESRFQFLGCLVCGALAAKHLGGFWGRGARRPVGQSMRRRSVESTPKAPGYFWGGESLTFEEACKHSVAIGGTGSGKSITLNLLAQSVLHKMVNADGVRRRAVIYDPKSDLAGFVAGVNQDVDVKIMNPRDARFTPWDLSADLQTETDAQEFASIFIPRNERESSPYFNDAARSLVAGVVKRFIATTEPGRRWTLRDLVLACETTAGMKAVLDFDGTRYLWEHFHPDNSKNYAGVKSTLDNTMSLYRPIAALADAAKEEPVSLREWLKCQDSVLLLGNSEAAREATDTLNRLVFRQLSKLLIDRPGRAENDETWIFLDEVREAGALSGLRQLLLRGRSKGVAVAMGFQDVEGIYAAYGEHEGAEIIGAAQNLVVLHINPSAPGTAEWASKAFSSRCDYVSGKSVTVGQQVSTSKNQHLELISNVLPVEFVELPMPSECSGLEYFAFTNTKGYGRGSYDWGFLRDEGPLRVQCRGVPDFWPQEEREAYRLRPWSGEDLRRLGLASRGRGGGPAELEARLLLSHPIDRVCFELN